ncbi:unnamed protein product [Chrysodeixis includens]|uniref:Chorein N-terminal domain-containing protein n=1 Tax=Chrysodeixis includens TaxID=689277 RepID=A0A9P0BL83_CHRIL|nr:unnamed protein product [Chrysodeixis includens]
MFKIESYVTPILLSYVDKYVRDFKPADAQVSLWGGGVALHNLVLKADVLQQEVALPFTLVSGRIHELLIQVPWTKIMSEPIIVTIDTIECVLSLNPPTTPDEIPPPDSPSRKTQVVEAPPGYMQALVRRIVSNIALRVHHLIVKYVQDDIVLSLNVKHLAVDSAGPNWEPAFADIDQSQPVIRRLVTLDDLTLCLDKSDSDGKIRFYQEPLLYRCQLDLRVLTRLVSANTRRATNLSVQLRSNRLAWSVTSDQLTLLLRLIRERPIIHKPQPPIPRQNTAQGPLNAASANSAEPARSESWSEWAWSWLPTWMDREGGVEEAPVPATPLPVNFTAYLDEVSLVFKVMESESNHRRRARGVLEVCASYAAIKSSICSPTSLRVRFGTRELELQSYGKCVCGYLNYKSCNDEPTVYLKKIYESDSSRESWHWPIEDLSEKVEVAEVVDESFRFAAEQFGVPEGDSSKGLVEGKSEEVQHDKSERDSQEESDELWAKMAPIVFVEYVHDRSPPQPYTNPYENPPKDFQYSDWVEDCNMVIKVEPMQVRVCTGLIHRMTALKNIYKEQPLLEATDNKQPMRILTVEECESLADNLPQKRIHLDARGFVLHFIPWDHVPTEKPTPPPVTLDIEVPRCNVAITGPLYPHRVCSAACQMPDDSGLLSQGARLQITTSLHGVKALISSLDGETQRPCARADVKLITKMLLNQTYFENTEITQFSYHLKIKELNICGSSARLQTAFKVPMSLFEETLSVALKFSTLVNDALNDEDAVAIDFTLEDFGLRGYVTRNVNMHVVALQSAKATAFHEKKGADVKQAWLFSAPDTPTTTPYLRLAVQWCNQAIPESFDYLGAWAEPTAMSVDPLLIAWLAYKPAYKPQDTITRVSSTSYFMRRRTTPPSSSGRGASRNSNNNAELVHVRSRSHGSSSEPSEKKEHKPPPPKTGPPEAWWGGERLVALHKRLRYMLLNVEVGVMLVYVTMSTASAIDCMTLRDAMERHASASHRVLGLSLGRLSMHSSPNTKQLWQELKHDGPTFVESKPECESFPWKVRLADVSCYTLELIKANPDLPGREGSKQGGWGGSNTILRSRLKAPRLASPRTVLELITTTITISVVTKTLQFKSVSRKHAKKPASSSTATATEPAKSKYFLTGLEFKPTTLKEFVRGPSGRRSKTSEVAPPTAVESHSSQKEPTEVVTVTDGPIISLGVHLHADTPPIITRIERDQLHIVAAAVHCFNHILTLLKRPSFSMPKPAMASSGSHRSLIRSVSEVEELATPSSTSEQSELISIFDSNKPSRAEQPLKTFLWFQWVVSRATLVIASQCVKLVFAIDDIISTVDIQAQYNQLKIKVASATVKHYERGGSEDWSAGVLSGRVLEAREPLDAKEDNHFLSITITQAQISNLPASWKEELHPKLLEQKDIDSMWEVYAMLAPLEAVIQPAIMENVVSLIDEMAPRQFCPLMSEAVNRPTPTWQWPFCYLTAGGLRLLVIGEDHEDKGKKDDSRKEKRERRENEFKRDDSEADDTFILNIGKVRLTPHPDNPICRRAVNSGTETGWVPAAGGYEGRQYEIFVKNVAISSATFRQLVASEESETSKGTTSENPALKWSRRIQSPTITPILHTVDICCVLAPALYTGLTLTCGPAVELNLVSDCAIELSLAHLVLIKHMQAEFESATKRRESTRTSSALDKHGVCPYAAVLIKHLGDISTPSETTLVEEIYTATVSKSVTNDSGIETLTSASSKLKSPDEVNVKKSYGVAFAEQVLDPSDFLEVYVTMGMIELSLYVQDDSSPEVIPLRIPRSDTNISEVSRSAVPNMVMDERPEEAKILRQGKVEGDSLSTGGSRSLTEMVRETDIVQTLMEIPTLTQQARKNEGNLPLIHVTLQQPNLYFWRKRTQKSLQYSLFDAWVGLGMGLVEGHWRMALLSTATGVPDPVTDILPALASLKIVAPVSASSHTSTNPIVSGRGSIRVDIERPVLIEVSEDSLMRLKGIVALLRKHHLISRKKRNSHETPGKIHKPGLHKIRKALLTEGIESITIQTSQIGICGSEGTMGWDSASLQLSCAARPSRLNVRVLATALLLATGPPGDRRHVVMQPLMLGMELEALWEAWRRAEGGMMALEPAIDIGVEFDRVIFDLRPADVIAAHRIMKVIEDVLDMTEKPFSTRSSFDRTSQHEGASPLHAQPKADTQPSAASMEHNEQENDHYYKDDLRSGAFKMSSGGQLPMAYQVVLHGSAVSWRYPHPRAITRVVAFPLLGYDKEIDCVLELYIALLGKWEPHTFFKIPIGEPRELHLNVPPPDSTFATMWRFRALGGSESVHIPYEFNINKFVPRSDPLFINHEPEHEKCKPVNDVTAEHLSGVLRVDSYFAPRLLPRTRIITRLAHLQIHLHNTLPQLPNQTNLLEGYYVSKPLMRSHRVLSVMSTQTTAHLHTGTPAGFMLVADTKLSCDIVDCSTGTMEQLVGEFRLQGGVTLSQLTQAGPRTRVTTTGIHVSLHVPRLRTLQALALDWRNAYEEYINNLLMEETEQPSGREMSKNEIAVETALVLEGRVSLWIHNSCASALRIGQEGTDEVVPLGPGARLAYRWRSPTQPKKLRVALAGPTTDWHWSTSIPFVAGHARLRLERLEPNSKGFPNQGLFVHVKTEEAGARRFMHLSGRLVLANMLRFNLLYKIRAHCSDASQWRTVCSGELASETVGRSVICGAECDMVLKIKFGAHETGWSGDIPLKECPKENVPWLVKVPSEGDVQYVSVWCRVVRARSDGRILATMWPLYVLHSHLPLDTDVLIVTEPTMTTSEDLTPMQLRPPPLLQTTPGRGTSTHLLAPGTTAARHNLSFQYRNIECPVTREAVPLHYGVTDVSVFDKRSPVANIDDVIAEILRWLERSGRHANTSWPYSIVSKHFQGTWQPALMQPRCDVTVRYQAVRAGGGCCLEIQLCPVVLLCNAAPIALTLRAHDAAPLCKLEPGTAISPPSAILNKPFFMSVEMGRETFVSGQLQVSAEEPGRYGAPPPGHVALDHGAVFSILCNQKVALLSLYYEIKQDINVLGITSTYVLINRLNKEILVSAIAVPIDIDEEYSLHPKTFKVVPPTKEGSINGTSLCRFWLRGRWRGGDLAELSTFLCLSLPAGINYPSRPPVPIRLGELPVRRAIALIDADRRSVPIVVTQIKHESRWLVVVAHDPCPQFAIHNHTRFPIAVGQPTHVDDAGSSHVTEPAVECKGARWWCVAYPASAIHYSTPAYCARYPPPTPPTTAAASSVPFLTFTRGKEEADFDWCAPVAAADGEQLIQFLGGHTIKLRVRTHPHSTLIELQDVDHNDISASDIRRRLFAGATMTSTESLHEYHNNKPAPSLPLKPPEDGLERITAQAAINLGNNEEKSLDNLKREDSLAKMPQASAFSQRLDHEAPPVSADTLTPTTPPAGHAEHLLTFSEPEHKHFKDMEPLMECERIRFVISGIAVEMAASADVLPLFALHLDRTALLVLSDTKKTKTILSIADAQIDNLQYENGQYDFAVVASTRAEPLEEDQWPPLWNMFAEDEPFATRQSSARLLLKLQHDKWDVVSYQYKELTEVEIRLGTLALYVEDAYVKAVVELSRLVLPAGHQDAATISEERSIRTPLRLRLLHVHPLDLTLTLHTAVRMYIALDQSPLRLSSFKLHDMMTSAERLTHALTVHYLSAAILGAGWVVGGLELLGAPGALAARVGGATGGVRGVASAAAAALLRSLSAWAGSLARNLDLLAGDEEHARRAAAARRRPPPSFVAGLVAGITNFAINILGAVGGLAHHPLVGVAVGETESGAAALRRGLLGALTKPLSATADLVAYAGTGLLRQTGWDPVPEPRRPWPALESRTTAGWRRDCVRWMFRMCELTALAGFEVLLDNAPLQLLFTHKFLVVADPETERIVEMIDFRFCSLGPYQGDIIELSVTQKRSSKAPEARGPDEDDEYQISAAAMARVARYTGAEGSQQSEMRVLSLLPKPGRSHSLHAALAAALHHNADTHFPML